MFLDEVETISHKITEKKELQRKGIKNKFLLVLPSKHEINKIKTKQKRNEQNKNKA